MFSKGEVIAHQKSKKWLGIFLCEDKDSVTVFVLRDNFGDFKGKTTIWPVERFSAERERYHAI